MPVTKKNAVKKKSAKKKKLPGLKSGAKSKKAKPNGNGGKAATEKAKVESALKLQSAELLALDFIHMLDGVEALVASIVPATLFPQKLLQFGEFLTRMASHVSATKKAFEKRALAHHDAKGQFQHGQVAVNFPETTKRTPKWKDEAIALGEALAELKGEVFDKDAFIKVLQEKYPEVTTARVKLTVSE